MIRSVVFIILLTVIHPARAKDPMDNLVDALVDKLIGVTSLSRGTQSIRPMFSTPRHPFPALHSSPRSLYPGVRRAEATESEAGSFYQKKKVSAKEQAQSAVAEARAAARAVQTEAKENPQAVGFAEKARSVEPPSGEALYTEEADLEKADFSDRRGAMSQLGAGAAWTLVGTPLLFKLFSPESGKQGSGNWIVGLNKAVYQKKRPSEPRPVPITAPGDER